MPIPHFGTMNTWDWLIRALELLMVNAWGIWSVGAPLCEAAPHAISLDSNLFWGRISSHFSRLKYG
jgi:hypothetical protein